MPAQAPIYRFGPYELRPRTRELYKAETKLKLRPQPFQILSVLVERAGDVVTREELRQLLWSKETFVDFEHGLNTSIKELRGVLSDSASEHRYIETLPKLGYRMIVPVEVGEALPVNHAIAQPQAKVAENLPGQMTLPDRPQRVWAIKRRAVLIGISLVLIVGLGSFLTWSRWRVRPQPASARLMLAVLPFENLTGDAGQDYFSDGLTEEMISQLGRLDPQHLGVIARTSVMHYKHSQKQLEQIGHELGVQYVLEGSVRRDPEKVRISAQLIQVKDQTHLWARQYDRELSSILALQSEIALQIADELKLALRDNHKQLSSARQSTPSHQINPEAYDYYLRGLYSYNRLTSDGLDGAIESYQKALSLDPSYAPAHAQLAQTYQTFAAYGQGPPNEFIPKSEAEAREAMREDPKLADPHFVLAYDLAAYEWNWTAAENEFEMGFALNLDSARGHTLYAVYLMAVGRSGEAIAEQMRARELDPLSPIANIALANTLFMSHNYDRTIEQCKRSAAMFPNHAEPHEVLTRAYFKKGMLAEAAAETQAAESRPGAARAMARAFSAGGYTALLKWELQDLQRKSQHQYVAPLLFALFYAALNDHDKALEWLERD